MLNVTEEVRKRPCNVRIWSNIIITGKNGFHIVPPQDKCITNRIAPYDTIFAA